MYLIMPFRSITKSARSETPFERSTPYLRATSPWGQKSESTGNQTPPISVVQAKRVGILSTVIPSNTVFLASKEARNKLYPGHCSEQTGVHAAGTKDITTFFFPAKALSETGPPERDGNVKSGALSPTFRVDLRVNSLKFTRLIYPSLVLFGYGESCSAHNERNEKELRKSHIFCSSNISFHL